jgi:LuxR family maltose regulon positive regulatory protein
MMDAIHLLTTKLYIPSTWPELVSRTRLVEQLNGGLYRKLTLVSAPAGFGKTTLVGEWVATDSHPVGWFSLDEDDSDPARFFTYLIAALRRVDPTIGHNAQAMCVSGQLILD